MKTYYGQFEVCFLEHKIVHANFVVAVLAQHCISPDIPFASFSNELGYLGHKLQEKNILSSLSLLREEIL